MYQLRDCVRRTLIQSVHYDLKVFTYVTEILTSIFDRLTDKLQQCVYCTTVSGFYCDPTLFIPLPPTKRRTRFLEIRTKKWDERKCGKVVSYTHRPPLPHRKYSWYSLLLGGPGSSVGIAAGYGLNGPGIETWWGRDFSHTSTPALGYIQPPVQWVLGLSRGKSAGAWCWPPTPS
jgi:hypothetical protein